MDTDKQTNTEKCKVTLRCLLHAFLYKAANPGEGDVYRYTEYDY